MVYLPTWIPLDFYGKCRLIYQSHGSSKIQSIWGNFFCKSALFEPPDVGKPCPKSSGDFVRVLIFKKKLPLNPSKIQVRKENIENCLALWIQVAARNALRVQFGGESIFLGGTWIHRVESWVELCVCIFLGLWV